MLTPPHHIPPRHAAPAEPVPTGPAMRVLASGSSGNCTLVRYSVGGWARGCLIDAGVSPSRIKPWLRHAGLSFADLDAILITHFDHDHFNPAWARVVPESVRFVVHERHALTASRLIHRKRLRVMADADHLAPALHAHAQTLDHDEHGVCAFRLHLKDDHAAGALGFATDVGRVTDGLIDLLRGVDVLGIESNYCPNLQLASSRPAFLKRRIMGGAGHLSNAEAQRAVEAIAPREHVVLLHLSSQCNRPDLAAELHAGADYALTIAQQHTPTRWVAIRGGAAAPAQVAPAQLTLFTEA